MWWTAWVKALLSGISKREKVHICGILNVRIEETSRLSMRSSKSRWSIRDQSRLSAGKKRKNATAAKASVFLVAADELRHSHLFLVYFSREKQII